MRTVIQFDASGNGRCLHTEAIDLSSLGELDVTRASRVEWSPRWQEWEVLPPKSDSPVCDLPLFQSPSRAECLAWERDYFNMQLITE
jgi:hypothetical protein